MKLTRRALLQKTSLALASVGLSQMGLLHLARRYQDVLAAPTSRKLALLIGINQYADEVCGFSSSKGTVLQGALTDVELHRELLVSRFGFHPSNIVTLVDQQATRDGIETALQFHLLDQVKRNDVVVFHFSGLGSTIQRSLGADADKGQQGTTTLERTLVPIDGILPSPDNPELCDVMQATLAACLNALPTDKIVSLLDIGYCSPSPLLGNLRVRSRLAPLSNVVLEDDSALQRRLREKRTRGLNVSSSAKGAFPGILMVGTNDQGIATEAHWDGFSAGALTYALTQNLWNTTPATSINISLGETIKALHQFVGQQHQPLIAGVSTTAKQGQTLPAYVNLSPTAFGADGSVLDYDDETSRLELWLAGLTPNVLQYCSDSFYLECFIPGDIVSTESQGAGVEKTRQEDTFVLLQGRSHSGLTVTAQLVPSAHSSVAVEAIPSGSLIQEKIRTIPKDVGLGVALDRDLARIERVDATSALSAIAKVTSSVAGEQQADCLFGKIGPSDLPSSDQPPASMTVSDELPDKDSDAEEVTIQRMYGIFKPGRSLIENTLNQSEEAVKTAIHRVKPQLKGLLALKFLQLTENQAGSRLGLEVSLDKISASVQKPLTLMVQSTSRSRFTPTQNLVPKWTGSVAIPKVQEGEQLQYRFNNYGDRPLYCLFMTVDSKGNIAALSPSGNFRAKTSADKAVTKGDIDASLVPMNTVTTVPPLNNSESWGLNRSRGLVTTYVIVSCEPFTETVEQLSQLNQPTGRSDAMLPLPDPLAVAHSILKDLNNASQSMIDRLALDVASDRYNLDMECWATFNFTYEVTPKAPSATSI